MPTDLLAESGPVDLLANKAPVDLLADKPITEKIKNWYWAPSESALTLGSGFLGSIVGGLAGFSAEIAKAQQKGYLGGTTIDSTDVIENTASTLTYGNEKFLSFLGNETVGKETTEEAEKILKVVNWPLEKWHEHVAKKGGELAQDLGAWPSVAAGIETALEFAPWIVLPEAYRRGKATPISEPALKLTFDERLEQQGLSQKDIADIKSEWTTLAETDAGGKPRAPKIVEDMKALVAPVGTGSPKAQALVKNYANELAHIDLMLADNFKEMTKRFTPKQLNEMWEAAYLDELAIADGATPYAVDKLPLDMRNQARATQAIHDGIAAQAVEAGVLPYHKEGWVPRNIIRTLGRPMAERIYGTRAVKTATKHAKKRKYKTVEETEAAAIELLGEDVRVSKDFRQYPLVDAELLRAVAGKKLIQEIRKEGVRNGEEFVKKWDGKTEPGYFTLENPAFVHQKPEIKLRPEGETGPMGGKTKVRVDEEGEIVWRREPLQISKDFEGPLRAVLEGNKNKLYRGIMKMKSASMQAIMVSPLMHGMVIWGKALPYQPIRSLTFRNYRDGHRIENITKTPKEKALNDEWVRNETNGAFKTSDEYKRFMMRTGHRPIGDMGWLQRMNDIMAAPSLGAGRSLVSRMVGYPAKFISKDLQLKAMRAVDMAGHFWHDTLLWDQVRASGYGMHLNIWKKLVKKGVDPELAGYVASHMANRFTGSLPFEDMSAGMRATMNAMLFSKSFTGTNLGLYTDALRGLPRAVQNQIIDNAVSMQGIGKANAEIRSAASATLMKDIIGMYVINALAQNAIKAWQESIDLEIAGFLDGPEGKKFANVDREKLQGAIDSIKDEYSMAAERYNAAQSIFDIDELSVTALNDPDKTHRAHWRTKPDGTWEYIRVPVGKVGEDLEMSFRHPLELLLNKLSPDLHFAQGVVLNDKTGARGYGIEVYDEDGTMIEKIGQVAMFFLESHMANEFAETFVDAVSGDDQAEDWWKFAMMSAGFSFSEGTPGGPIGGTEYKILDQKIRAARRAQRKAKPLLEQGKYEQATDILINEGRMSPEEIKSWMTRKLAPELKSLNAKRIQEVYIHADELERLRIEQQLKQKFMDE